MKRTYGVDETEYPHETWEDHQARTALEALEYSEKHGFLSNEEVELKMAKHKYDALKKLKKVA